MKCNFKISLPLYKLLYSMVFMFVMALIRPTVTPIEILTVIEPNLCFLAIVFVADIYYCEFRENRINVFYLFPDRLKYKAVVQRFLIDFVYLVLLDLIFYWIYILFQNSNLFTKEIISIYGYSILMCFMTVLFFASLSVTMVNFFQNMWFGLVISLAVWFVFNTKVKEYLPTVLNIFAYKITPEINGGITPYFFNRALYMVVGIVMLIMNYLLVKRSPMRQVKEGKK